MDEFARLASIAVQKSDLRMVDEIIKRAVAIPYARGVEEWMRGSPTRRRSLRTLWAPEEVDIDDADVASVYPDFYAAKSHDPELLQAIYARGCPSTDVLLQKVLVKELHRDEMRVAKCIEAWFSKRRDELKYR